MTSITCKGRAPPDTSETWGLGARALALLPCSPAFRSPLLSLGLTCERDPGTHAAPLPWTVLPDYRNLWVSGMPSRESLKN